MRSSSKHGIAGTLKRALLLAGLSLVLAACDNGGGEGNDTSPPLPKMTLSGTISSGAGSMTDGDVNDPNAAYVANDTPAQAQSVPSPVMIGGYLNRAGTGWPGPSFSPGDTSDFYRINLAANQTITLNIADFNTGDLDLFLYYDDGSIDIANPDFFSNGIGDTETLTAPSSGDYLIEVYAYSGYTNYALVVGQGIASQGGERLVSSDDFVPGEVIVRFRDTLLPQAATKGPAARAAALGLQARAGASGRAMLFGLGDVQQRQAAFRALGIAPGDGGGARRFKAADPERQLKLDTLQVIKALRKRADVLYAEPNYLRRPLLVPTDEYYDLQWHYPLIGLPSAWDVSTGDAGVVVAVVDTGVLMSHPDLQGQFSADGGYDFISDDTISGDGEPGIDSNPDDTGDSAVGGSSFHGTHVAGTIAAATTFGGGGSGVAGVAPGVKIMPLRALGIGGGTAYDINQAVRYAAGLSNDSGTVPPKPADVINLSLGGGAFSQAEQDVYTQVRNAGVIVVAAAGNDSSGSPSYPAGYDGVISVSAVDMSKQLAPYSNYGSTIDVAAPGGDTAVDLNGDGYPDGVLSPLGDDSDNDPNTPIVFTYGFYQGTSMASPHMAGVVALMKSIYAALTPGDVDGLLSSGQIVEDLGASGRDDSFGHGLINARAAVDAATSLASGTVIENPVVSAAPAALNFGVGASTLTLSVSNAGTGSLSITSISDDATWLSVTADQVDATGLGSYRVTVDRTGLGSGTYTAAITIVSDANTITVPVIQQVGGQTSDLDAGYQYVLLIDAATADVVAQWDGAPQSGIYNFRFDNVTFASGQRYVIYAGTDLNNDGLICDAGEACGAYISREKPKAIASTDNLAGLDFVSGFNIGLRAASTTGPGIPAGGIRYRTPTKRLR